MIEPVLSDDAFLADVESTLSGDLLGQLHLWWLGQSGFLIQHDGAGLLLDPYLSESLTTKYANTDKPHVRMTRRVIDPARLAPYADFVTSSHNHTDHLDADTLRPLIAAQAAEELNPFRLVIPEANRAFVMDRLGTPYEHVTGLDDGQTAEVYGIPFTGVAAAHEAVERDEAGRCKFLGYVMRLGRWTVYHSGDTVVYDGMVERLRPLNIDLALLPINGRAPERRVAGNLSGTEAARLANDIGAKLVIPCHYEMFEFNTATPDEFAAECERLGQPYRVLRAGERYTAGR
jgi:L-ascorbate metabolism protein UlaG (beta-lactamase superfamily)